MNIFAGEPSMSTVIIRLATKHPNASGGIARGIFSLLFRK
jgi:hypothetical protein